MAQQTFNTRLFGDPAPLTPRPMSESASMVSQIMLPNDANPMGNVHGGSIMRMVDVAAAIAALRHCRRQVVTKALDHMSFDAPVFIGDLVTITSRVEYAGRTSMVVRAEVEAENPATGRKVHTSSCFLTFVALDEHGQTVPVPPVLAETPDEQEHMEVAHQLYERGKEERARRARKASQP